VRLKLIECFILLQLINHVGNGRCFKDGDFSVEDRSGQPKKFEDKELEALLEDQIQTQEEFAESLGVTSRFYTIDSHGNDSKTRKLNA